MKRWAVIPIVHDAAATLPRDKNGSSDPRFLRDDSSMAHSPTETGDRGNLFLEQCSEPRLQIFLSTPLKERRLSEVEADLYV